MDIDHVHLSRLDLNLLVSLEVLLDEQSVTRAARRMGVTQSAMSHSLSRLRTLFGDELLTRVPQGMRPTPRAVGLHDKLRGVLAQVQALTMRPRDFDPATADMLFTLGMADSSEVMMMPRMLARFQVEAPSLRFLLRNVDRQRVLEDLDSGRIDLAIGLFQDGKQHHKRRVLLHDRYMCIYNPRLLDLPDPIGLEDYIRLPHLLTSLVETPVGVVDTALAKLGLTRHIAMTSPRFSAIPFVLEQAPVIATMHARVAAYFAETMQLRVCPPPIDLPDVPISMIWHSSNDNVPAHRWLREQIVSIRSGGFGHWTPGAPPKMTGQGG